jgi:hypothetical protein
LRQDSGDPFVFAPRAKEVYEQLGINPSEKLIVYSDSLSVEKAIALKKQCDELGLNRGFPFFIIPLHDVTSCMIDSKRVCSWLRYRHFFHKRLQVAVKWRQREEQGAQHGHQNGNNRRASMHQDQ